MSIGSLGGIAASIAGTSLAQAKGSEVDRVQQDTNAQQRQVHNEVKADSAAGIGETDGQEESAADRDANGRRPWERIGDGPSETDAEGTSGSHSRDATGESGTQLDLSG
jgi:hypothetical protein